MIKIGRLPGKLYQVDFEEGMTVGQAITKARALAEEQGKSLDVAGCQIRISGNEVNESALLANNSVVTISQKIKGNSEGIVLVTYNQRQEELMISDETTAGEILEILGLENENLEVRTVEGDSLDDDDELMDNGSVFVIGEKIESEEDDDEDYDDEYIEEGEDYENDYGDDDEDDEDEEEERTCNCGGNCHRHRDVTPVQVNVKQEAEISNGRTLIKIVVEGENVGDVNDKIHQLIRKAKHLL